MAIWYRYFVNVWQGSCNCMPGILMDKYEIKNEPRQDEFNDLPNDPYMSPFVFLQLHYLSLKFIVCRFISPVRYPIIPCTSCRFFPSSLFKRNPAIIFFRFYRIIYCHAICRVCYFSHGFHLSSSVRSRISQSEYIITSILDL